MTESEEALLKLARVQFPDLTAPEENALRAWVADKFGHPFEVIFSYHEEIPRSTAGKYQDFVSELDR